MSNRTVGRREALGVMGAAGAALAFGCGGSPTSPDTSTSTSTTTTGSTNAACAVTPTETAGPYPSLTDIFRSDIRDGKTGTLLTLTVKVVNVTAGCAAVANANVEVTFTTIYPGWYQGRATHIHLEVTINGVSRKVTQIAFPESVNNTVYRSGVYASRGSNPTSNLSDGIFADSLSAELVTPSGDTVNGYTAGCQVGVSL